MVGRWGVGLRDGAGVSWSGEGTSASINASGGSVEAEVGEAPGPQRASSSPSSPARRAPRMRRRRARGSPFRRGPRGFTAGWSGTQVAVEIGPTFR